jgi:hypothetical protein
MTQYPTRTFLAPAWPIATPTQYVLPEDARNKLCCGPQYCGVLGDSADGSLRGVRLCAGEACMAWRRGDELVERTETLWLDSPGGTLVRECSGQVYEKPYPRVQQFCPDGEGWRLTRLMRDPSYSHWERSKGFRGYCGFVGVEDSNGATARHGAGGGSLERRR